MLKEMYEQLRFGGDFVISKEPKLSSPYLKCKLLTEDVMIIVEFSTTRDIPLDEIDYRLHFGDIDILSISLYPRYDVNRN